MKKLLSILGAVTIMASSGTVVACSPKVKRFETPDITTALYNKIIAGLKNDSGFSWTQGQGFDSLDFKDILLKMINEEISKQYVDSQQTDLYLKLGLQATSKLTSDQIMNRIVSNELFNEYTASLTKGNDNASFDNSVWKKYKLNPFNLDIENGKDKNDNNYTVWFNDKADGTGTWKRWQTSYEFGKQATATNVPTMALMSDRNNKNFAVMIGGNDNLNDVKWDENKIFKKDLSASEILQYRFQDYFTSSIRPKYFDNLLAASYINGRIYKSPSTSKDLSRKMVTFDTSSELAKTVQTWNSDARKMKSKVMMVWNFSVNNKKDDKEAAQKALEGIINNNGALNTERSIVDVWAALEKTGDKNNNSKAGLDPYFNLTGFNGFVKPDGESVSSISGNLILKDDAKTALAKSSYNDRPLVLTNNGNGYSSDTDNNVDYILAVPVYMQDLLNSSDSQITKTGQEYSMKAHKNTWVSLNDKFINNSFEVFDWNSEVTEVAGLQIAKISNVPYFKLTADTGSFRVNDKTITVTAAESMNSFDLIDKLDESVIGQLPGASKDDSLAYNVSITGTKDPYQNAEYSINWSDTRKQSTDIANLNSSKKQTLLSELQFMASKEDQAIDNAKTVLYKEYLSEDGIKYQGLYDAISKYIKDSEDQTD
ncbi:hypothetical protein CXP39_01255 [Mesoplasma syrphidae]|uniref:Lipoprotein n=1 Tax=Mesoplasma syrphidae TaxID=225999 RepID=A0A2K9C1T1_9MOLU|nr:lipoprotein [Mesoplasma syrphidae]AUF83429.1 hypothetical protein CXP39_01255 [Mesoplasma syrphidae]